MLYSTPGPHWVQSPLHHSTTQKPGQQHSMQNRNKSLTDRQTTIQEIRQNILRDTSLLCIAKIRPHGCLIVPQPHTVGNQQPDKIVVPTPILPSVLWHMHQAENHPSKTQLKAKFDRMFLGIIAQQNINNIHAECFQCKVQLPYTATRLAAKSCTQESTSMQTSFAGRNKKFSSCKINFPLSQWRPSYPPNSIRT
jgi:hypothetical protein